MTLPYVFDLTAFSPLPESSNLLFHASIYRDSAIRRVFAAAI